MRTPIPFLLASAVLVLALSACGSPTPTDAGDTSAPPTPTPSPTETTGPLEPDATRADYGFTFFEEAQIGSSFAEISAQLHYPVGPYDGCPYYANVWTTELFTTSAFTDVDNPGGPIVFFYSNRFLAPDDAEFPRNAEGVGIGSTEAEILAAYPSAVVEAATDPGAGPLTKYTVDDPDSDSRYVFAISDGSAVVDLLQWGPEAGNQWSHLCGGL